jgi:hypothetical protein
MERAIRKTVRGGGIWIFFSAVLATTELVSISAANADEANAKSLFKAMSDYLASQKAISIAFDSNLEIVTAQNQKLGLASSGTVTLSRPDKILATRTGGFASVELVFDGKTLTLLGKNAKVYAQVEAPGTIDQLVDALRDKYHRPVPAADLLMSDVYNQLMPLVEDTKDLGSGVIGGVECDHLASDRKKWIGRSGSPRETVLTRAATSSPAERLSGRRNTPLTSRHGRPVPMSGRMNLPRRSPPTLKDRSK